MQIQPAFSSRYAGVAPLMPMLLIAACGGTDLMPSSPSSGSGSATITGTVMSASTAPLVVAVPAAGVSAPVASNGQFTLSNVPGGDIELRLTGPGLDVRITIGRVDANERVTITIRVEAGRATVERISRRRDDDDDDEFRGAVSRRSGSCPNLTFMVGQRSVRSNAGTLFRRVTCDLLVNGQVVEVDGSTDAAGQVLASKVQLENAQGVERRGSLTAVSGSCPNLSFSVGGHVFFTNNTTEFDDVACAGLREGTNVEAKGHLQSNGLVLTERVRRR